MKDTIWSPILLLPAVGTALLFPGFYFSMDESLSAPFFMGSIVLNGVGVFLYIRASRRWESHKKSPLRKKK